MASKNIPEFVYESIYIPELPGNLLLCNETLGHGFFLYNMWKESLIYNSDINLELE